MEGLARPEHLASLTMSLTRTISERLRFATRFVRSSQDRYEGLRNDLTGVQDEKVYIDLGFFDLDNPVKKFENPNGEVKTALFNYGIAAVVYLILGRFLERIIRP